MIDINKVIAASVNEGVAVRADQYMQNESNDTIKRAIDRFGVVSGAAFLTGFCLAVATMELADGGELDEVSDA